MLGGALCFAVQPRDNAAVRSSQECDAIVARTSRSPGRAIADRRRRSRPSIAAAWKRKRKAGTSHAKSCGSRFSAMTPANISPRYPCSVRVCSACGYIAGTSVSSKGSSASPSASSNHRRASAWAISTAWVARPIHVPWLAGPRQAERGGSGRLLSALQGAMPQTCRPSAPYDWDLIRTADDCASAQAAWSGVGRSAFLCPTMSARVGRQVPDRNDFADPPRANETPTPDNTGHTPALPRSASARRARPAARPSVSVYKGWLRLPEQLCPTGFAGGLSLEPPCCRSASSRPICTGTTSTRRRIASTWSRASATVSWSTRQPRGDSAALMKPMFPSCSPACQGSA